MKITNKFLKKILLTGIMFFFIHYLSYANNINSSAYVAVYVDSQIDNDGNRTTGKMMKINKEGQKEVFENSVPTTLDAFKKQGDYVYWSYFKVVPKSLYYFKKNINDNYTVPATPISALEFHYVPGTSYWGSDDISWDDYSKTVGGMNQFGKQFYKGNTVVLSDNGFDIVKNGSYEKLFGKTWEVTWNGFYWIDEKTDTLYYKTHDYYEDKSWKTGWVMYNFLTKTKSIYESFDKIPGVSSFDTDKGNSVFCSYFGLKVKEKNGNINNIITDEGIVAGNWMHGLDKQCLIFTNTSDIQFDNNQTQNNSICIGTITQGVCSQTQFDFHYYNYQTSQNNTTLINNSNSISNTNQDTVDPVILSNGEFDYSNTLLSFKNPGINHDFNIKYSSQVYYNGPLGFNFNHNQNIYISKNDGTINLYNGLFSISKFNPQQRYNSSLRASLSKENELYTITFDNGKKYYFNGFNKISKIVDKNGNSLSYFYDEDKKLIKTIDTLGKEINYIYNTDSRLEKIITSNHDEVIFAYDENKDLISIKTGKNGNFKEIKFEYISGNANESLNHNITKLIDSKGQTYVENIYDESDRVQSQKYGNGTVTYNYTTNESGKVIKNNVTNRNGTKSEYNFDENGNILSRKVQTSNEMVEFKFEYDSNGKITKDTQPNGNSLEYSYDNLGRMLSKKEIGEYEKTTAYEYATNFETPTKITKQNGLIIENTLDEKGNVIQTKVINGNEVLETTYEYDSAGQLIHTIDPNGLKTTLEYQNGNVIKITKKEDSIFSLEKIETQFEYDNAGNITKEIDGNGNAKNLTYNDFNQIIQSISAEGIINSFEYDGNGNTIKQGQKLDTSTDINITKAYDILDHVSEVSNPISQNQTAQTKFEYDGNENIKKITYPNGTTKDFFYNEFDKVTKTIFEGIETKYEYDKNGNITKIIDAHGNYKTLEYNLFNEVIKITDELGNITHLTYNISGNVTKVEVSNKNGKLLSKQEKEYDLLGNTLKEIIYNLEGNTQMSTSYSYNKGLLIEKIDAQGNKTTLNYDDFGRTISTIDSLGNKQTFEYDKNSNITKKSIISSTGKTINTYYLYDKDNRVIGEKSHDNILKGYVYNNLNQIVGVIDKNGNKTTLEYNYIGKVTKKSQVVSGKTIITQFEYDVNGNLTAVIDGNGNKTSYIYDDFNRLIKEVYADEKQVIYEYDLLGNIIKKTDPNGNIISNIYDYSNRLIERNISNPSGIIGTIKETYAYDDLGRLINSKSIDNTGKTIETSFTYNSLNQLTSETNNGKTIKYEYDTKGNQVKVIYKVNCEARESTLGCPNGKVIEKSYDEIDRIKSINLDNKTLTNYNYSGLELVNQINGNNTKTNYSYDDLGRLQTLKNIFLDEVKKGKNTSTKENIINDFVFSYDDIGNITGNGLENYNYDEISRLINVNIPDTNIKNDRKNIEVNTSFLYDNVGNRDSLEQTTTWETKKGKEKEKVKIADYSNNSLNQYTILESYTEKNEKESKKNKVKNFIYDNSGNLIQDEKQKYFYDYNNRLIKVEKFKKKDKTEIISEYSYDTLGRRVEKVVYEDDEDEKQVVKYTYAGNNAILEESYEFEDKKLKLKETKENIYSNQIDDILASIITKDGRSNIYYYTKNQLGSITSITDEKGKIVEEYKYDVFGKAYTRSGKSENWREFKESKIDNTRLFTGREYDQEIGWYYYRARYYDSEIGRFISRDPIGQVDDINLYGYVGNNSVNFIDPSGLEKVLLAMNETRFIYEKILMGNLGNKQEYYIYGVNVILSPTEYDLLSGFGVGDLWNLSSNRINAEENGEYLSAIDYEKKNYGDVKDGLNKLGWQNSNNVYSDALRHSYRNALNAKYFGIEKAKQIGDSHEMFDGNLGHTSFMDLYNNSIGRSIGYENRDKSDGEILAQIIANKDKLFYGEPGKDSYWKANTFSQGVMDKTLTLMQEDLQMSFKIN